jgi:hypothetical protein
LIALFSDYFNGYPKIAALFFSSELEKSDWSNIQKPKESSAMTSFSCISKKGFIKLKSGLKICIDEKEYLKFFS